MVATRTYPPPSVRFLDGPLADQVLVLDWIRISPPSCLWVEIVDGRPGRSGPCSHPPEDPAGCVQYNVAPEYRAKPGTPHLGTLRDPD